MSETLKATTLGALKKGSVVNLERALSARSRFGGHFVTGHVDTVGIIRTITKQKNFVKFQISIPKKYIRYLVPKGSVTIDGVSLTVGEVGESSFSVYLIPHTLKSTTLGMKTASGKVNVEVDLLAKYILSGQKSKK